MFVIFEKCCGLETRLSLSESAVAAKEEELNSLKEENEDLQKQVSELTGHGNRQQKVSISFAKALVFFMKGHFFLNGQK